jgi:ribosomal protein S18 acetylase RimI-like enzyme
MNEAHSLAIMIRPALAQDADGIARTFLESAEYHTRMDPERYSVPALETIATRYRERQSVDEQAITLVAELHAEIVGFVDVRLDQSPDLMHRDIIYCHIAEIAVSDRHQSHGIGSLLLQAAEDWGRQMNAEFASLEFHVENKRAALFYQARMGYRPASITAIKRL